MADEIRVDENGMENMEGKKGTKVIAPGLPFQIGTPVSEYLPLKEEWIPRISEAFMNAKGTPNERVISQMFEGPDVGIDIDDETGEVAIAEGWTVKDGYVVRA